MTIKRKKKYTKKEQDKDQKKAKRKLKLLKATGLWKSYGRNKSGL